MTTLEMMERTLGKMKTEHPFSRNELLMEMMKCGAIVSIASLNAGIDKMLQRGDIARVGRNAYYVPPHYMRRYEYDYSKQARSVVQRIEERYPYLDFVVFELIQLNEFVNHQLAHNTIFVYAEPFATEFVFDMLWDCYDGMVLLKPSRKEYDRYWDEDAVVVKKLVSEAPLARRAKWKSRLEKILVDLFADKLLRDLLSPAELSRVYQDSFHKYIIDESSLFRYAKRRSKAKRIRRFIHEETDIVLRGQ